MSARDELVAALTSRRSLGAGEAADIAWLVDKALTKHAHELAETIRVEAVNATANDQQRERRALLDLADWFDPEVNING